MNRPRFAALVLTIAAATAARFLPHPPNFAPIAAIALFGGAYLPNRRFAVLVVAASMLLSDIFLGFHPLMPLVYLCLLAAVGLGWAVRERKTVFSIAAVSVLSSVLFFVVTNLGEWAFGAMYPGTIEGLVACFTMAIPFFHNTLFGDLFFTALIFGGFALLEANVAALRGHAGTKAVIA